MADNLPQRLKGQEVSILITTGGVLEDSLVDITDFTATAMFQLISKGYLGEKSERKDEIYKGIKFELTLHLHTQRWFAFQNAIKLRAQRQTPNTKFNITAVMQFPNGDTPTITIADAKFGEQPLSVKGREEMVEAKIQGEAEDFSQDVT
jgi:hypothetical protein